MKNEEKTGTNIDIYSEIFKVVKLENGGYLGQSVNIPGCLTHGKDLDELKKRCKIALKSYVSMVQKLIDEDNISFYQTAGLREDLDIRVNKKL